MTIRLECRIGLELATQVGDVDVAGSLVSDVRALPEVLHDLLAAEDALWLTREQVEEPELGRCQRDQVSIDAYLVTDWIEFEAADSTGRADSFTVELATAEDRANPSDQLGHRERLGHVVVGADLEAHHAIELGAFAP